MRPEPSKLLLVEGAVLRRLNTGKVSLARLHKGESRRDRLLEELVVAMGLLFKLLAPMRNVTAMDNCARGIDAMALEEAAYWLGMAMHRKKTAGCWRPCACCSLQIEWCNVATVDHGPSVHHDRQNSLNGRPCT